MVPPGVGGIIPPSARLIVGKAKPLPPKPGIQLGAVNLIFPSVLFHSEAMLLNIVCAPVRRELNMLADSPEFLTDRQIVKATNLNNTTKGVNATQAVNILARRLQADWMVENAYVEDKVYDEEGNDITPKVPNYRKIRSIGYLKEAIAWNADLNCDRISSLGMAMLYDAELQKYETGVRKEKIKTLGDDPFFSKHYRGKRLMGSYPNN
jgi:hypothetical protein